MKDKIELSVDEMQIKTQLHKIKELNEILVNIGIVIEIEDRSESDLGYKCVKINYDKFEAYKIKARGAGRPRKQMKKIIKVEELCKRMEKESALKIAEDLGISRETLYRKLKYAKEHGCEYL